MQNVVNEMNQNDIEIQNKEEDLLLAAKLGQSLLEQNEELSSENQRLIKKVEVTHLQIKEKDFNSISGLTTRKLCSEKGSAGC